MLDITYYIACFALSTTSYICFILLCRKQTKQIDELKRKLSSSNELSEALAQHLKKYAPKPQANGLDCSEAMQIQMDIAAALGEIVHLTDKTYTINSPLVINGAVKISD